MNHTLNAFKNFIHDEQGATAIEYGLLVALISLLIVSGAAVVGTNLRDLFTHLSTCLAHPNVANCTPL